MLASLGDSPGEAGVGEGVLGGVDPCFLLKILRVVVPQHQSEELEGCAGRTGASMVTEGCYLLEHGLNNVVGVPHALSLSWPVLVNPGRPPLVAEPVVVEVLVQLWTSELM